MKLKYILLSGFGLAVILLSVSCQSGTKPIVATSSIVTETSTTMSQSLLAPTMTETLSTATAIIRAETTSEPVLDPTSSPTIALETATPLPILAMPTITAVTLTPLPTFAANELEAAVTKLLANPMNCDVPCWWGAIPNKTTFFDIQQFIVLYQFTDYVRYMEQIPDDSFELGIRHENSEYGFLVRYGFDENAMLTSLESGHAPPVSDVLKKYGQPDEVWLATAIAPAPMPVRLNLVYLQESMAFGYVVNNVGQTRDLIQGCFVNDTGNIILKPPYSVTMYTDFFNLFELERLYLPLEAATDLTMDDFMQLFSDPTQPQCIETPTELWD